MKGILASFHPTSAPVPLLAGSNVFALMTLPRTCRTPFREDDKDTLEAYARLLSDFLQQEQIKGYRSPPFTSLPVEALLEKVAKSVMG